MYILRFTRICVIVHLDSLIWFIRFWFCVASNINILFGCRYNSAIKYLLTVPKYRNKALQIAKDKNLLESVKKTRGKNKTELKEETDGIILKVLEENMDIRYGQKNLSSI